MSIVGIKDAAIQLRELAGRGPRRVEVEREHPSEGLDMLMLALSAQTCLIEQVQEHLASLSGQIAVLEQRKDGGRGTGSAVSSVRRLWVALVGLGLSFVAGVWLSDVVRTYLEPHLQALYGIVSSWGP